MRYINLVYAKHHDTDRRAYLYELPLDQEAMKGDRLSVTDKHGSHFVTAFGDNFMVSPRTAKMLAEANGGYYPPAPVVGFVHTINIRKEVTEYFDKPNLMKEDIPF